MRLNLSFIVLLLAFTACSKKDNNNYTKHIGSGMHTFMGSVSASGRAPCEDAFYQIRIRVLDNETLLVINDTLKYLETDESSNSFVFLHSRNPLYTRINEERLYFNRSNFKIRYTAQYNGSGGVGAYYDLTTDGYSPNRSLSLHRSFIQGSHSFHGLQHDLSYGPNLDTTYAVSKHVEFSFTSDSTIQFNGSVLTTYDYTLHYRSINVADTLIVWQSYHSEAISSTLSYNYITHKLKFAQQYHELFSIYSDVLME